MFSWTVPRRKPLIIAHRGSSIAAPENTLVAFRRAIEDGADAVELDVRITADREIVVFHDTALRRTTNGSGAVEQKTLRQLKLLSAGSWFHRCFESEKIPTLDEVFEILQGRLGLNVEIKSSRNNSRRFDIVDRCMAIVRNHQVASSVLISSFQHEYLDDLRSAHPEMPVGYLYRPLKSVGRFVARMTKKEHCDYVILNNAGISRRLVERVHTAGLLVGEFTVKTPRQFSRALRLGVDAVFTDDPARMRKYLIA